MEGVLAEGFSKLPKEEKIRFVADVIHDPDFTKEAASYWHPEKQEIFDSFSENTLTNYYLPFGVAPNFLINNRIYHIPMVVEESSVVAAAAAGAKFWLTRGGFKSEVISTTKKGHIHFLWAGSKEILKDIFPAMQERLMAGTKHLTPKMEQRGGGIKSISLEDYTSLIANYYRISIDFETVDSMGANFINSVLESMAEIMQVFVSEKLPAEQQNLEIIMSILSNNVPECLVECQVTCPVEQFDRIDGETPWKVFVHKFKIAVDIANIDPSRAATHNKGIMNGADAVVIATGNDFRAAEAGVHVYAARSGGYKSLSKVDVSNGILNFSLRMPMAVGTVGGLTNLHPMAKRAMQLLGNPNAKELMTIIAAVGLSNNFSAVKSLVTKGIQRGHMKMHLSNIIMPYNLTKEQKKIVENYFSTAPVSHAAVENFIKGQFPGIT